MTTTKQVELAKSYIFISNGSGSKPNENEIDLIGLLGSIRDSLDPLVTELIGEGKFRYVRHVLSDYNSKDYLTQKGLLDSHKIYEVKHYTEFSKHHGVEPTMVTNVVLSAVEVASISCRILEEFKLDIDSAKDLERLVNAYMSKSPESIASLDSKAIKKFANVEVYSYRTMSNLYRQVLESMGLLK